MGPHPAVAAVRFAVRLHLQDLPAEVPLLVACSGGADSVALAAAVAFEVRHGGRSAGLVTVDHQLQAGSAGRAGGVAAFGHELGFDPVLVLPVVVGRQGGPEGAARQARYLALDSAAAGYGVPTAAVLLGHTADDQAETVLLGLGRGSGPRSIAGMRARSGRYHRPLLAVRRSETRAACIALGLSVWDDPQNQDARFVRSRLRGEALPLLEDILGGGVAPALARTAEQLQQDQDALGEWAGRVLAAALTPERTLLVARLEAEPVAVLGRVLKRWAETVGAGPLSAVHVRSLLDLLLRWHGQAAIDLPGGYSAFRSSGTLGLSPHR
jgi:tRNA(Ile)-lysidine synthase